MLLLTDTQVQPCRVIRRNIFEEIVLPGLAYRDRLFFRVGQYSLELAAEARQQALAVFQEAKETFLVLVVRIEDQWTLWLEDPELQYCSAVQAKAKRVEQIDLVALTQRIRGCRGLLEIRDRRIGLKLNKRCFRADQLLDCLVEQYELPRKEAMRLGQRLINERHIYHLDHSKNLQDGKALYRFYEDEL